VKDGKNCMPNMQFFKKKEVNAGPWHVQKSGLFHTIMEMFKHTKGADRAGSLPLPIPVSR
jgi:hypothetical protein